MKLSQVFAASCILLLLASCTTNPVLNVNSEPLPTTETRYDLDDVKRAIIQAAVSLGWKTKVVSSEQIVATLDIRRHMAQVEISYDTQTYSINYRDSANLKYSSEEGTIHRNYNNWIINLKNHINANLATL